MTIPLIKRRASATVVEALGDTRVVLVLGARRVGKSTMCNQIARNDHPATTYALAGRITEDQLATLPHDHIRPTAGDGSLWETDVIPVELRRLFGNETFVWGGDLNSAEDMDDVPNFAGGNRQLRENWREAGSFDLRRGFFEQEQQTFFRPNTKPWQIDHVFADEATRDRVVGWHVDPTPAVEYEPPLSDHAPIVIEID